MKHFLRTLFGTVLMVLASIAAAQSTDDYFPPPGGWVADSEANRATQFCLKESSTNRLTDQPLNQGTCGSLLIAGAAYTYFSGDTTLAELLLNSNQRDWAITAIGLACIGGDVARQSAVRLIQACNCHNWDAMSAIENNQDQVIQVLKIRSEGNTSYPGCSAYKLRRR